MAVPGMQQLVKDLNTQLTELEEGWKQQVEEGTVTWDSVMTEMEKASGPFNYGEK